MSQGALPFSNKGHLSQILKEKIPIKSLLKLRNYNKMMNCELCINDFIFNPWFVLSFSILTNPELMGERLQTQKSMDIG